MTNSILPRSLIGASDKINKHKTPTPFYCIINCIVAYYENIVQSNRKMEKIISKES